MPFFNRVSETFWSYVSPQKTDANSNTPKTAPTAFKQRALPIRHASLKNLKRRKSMSPYERVDSWRATTSTSPGNNDNRRAVTPDRNGDGSRKMRKLDDGRAFRAEEVVYEHQEDEEDEEDDERSTSDEIMRDDDGLSSMFSAVHVNGSPTPEDFLNDYESEVDVDVTEVLDDGDYHLTPNRRKLATLPQDESAFGVGSQELRDAGWDDDYITLVQRIKLRGHESLMPQRWQFNFRSMPDALFAKTNDAFISSVQREYFRAEKALEKLLDLGGLVRDSLSPDTPTRPHRQIRQNIEAYQKWALLDSGLDPETVIPVLTLIVRPGDIPAEELHDIANQKLDRIAARYRKAFRVLQSTEGSPVSKASSQYSYPIPTLYAIVASHALIAVMAYRPEDETPDAKPIAFFDMKESNYDVWNSLALAITVCHARNVQVRIAEDTGLGVKVRGGKRSRASEDPDA